MNKEKLKGKTYDKIVLEMTNQIESLTRGLRTLQVRVKFLEDKINETEKAEFGYTSNPVEW